MKRKGSKKAQQPEDPNDVDEQMEENGSASEDVDVDDESEDEPYEKRRKSSKSNKKNVSFSKKGSENDEEVTKKSKKKNSKESKEFTDEDDAKDQDEEGDTHYKKKKKSKKSKDIKNDDDDDSEADQDEEDETQYEVEKVLDEKMIKGVRHYLIRWKGYEEESDTWEPDDTLNCPELIEAFKENKKKSNKSGSKIKKPSAKKQKDSSDDQQEWDENEDFEVEKILEVHHRKNGKKEFLVVWKGYGLKDSSWEPEENMNCKDLIARFMAKVETARNYEEKELRANRKHVQRLTYNTPDSNRRLSKRNSGKERVQYHDAE